MKYKVTMRHFTRSLGGKLVDYIITEEITATGFSLKKDAEDYAISCRAVNFSNVKVEEEE